MCNLYTERLSAAEVAAHFGVDVPNIVATNAPSTVHPGAPGMVVRAENGRRILQSMGWGFPLKLASMKPGSKPKAVNNIADLRKPMWVGLARKPEWRCLIPLTAWAEPAGIKGRKTRTWLSLKDRPIFAWGGLWRDSAEWGPVYSGAMTDANEAAAKIHSRMPVLLHEEEYDDWLHGSFDDLIGFQDRVFPSGLTEIEPTDEPWHGWPTGMRQAALL